MPTPPSESTLIVNDTSTGPGVVRELILNRPRRRNALDTGLAQKLRDQLDVIDRDDDVRAVVLSGNGDHFCAGGDLKEFIGLDDARDRMLHRAALIADIQQQLRDLRVPAVAAVQGAALGAGAALALSADMTVAGSDLTLGYPEINDGVVPALVMTHPIHLLGQKLAFEMITTGRRLDAPEALAQGLVNSVEAVDPVRQTALAVASTWAGLDPVALRRAKALFYRVVELPHAAAIRAGFDVTGATWQPK